MVLLNNLLRIKSSVVTGTIKHDGGKMCEEELFIPRIYWSENPGGYAVYGETADRIYVDDDIVFTKENSELVESLEN